MRQPTALFKSAVSVILSLSIHVALGAWLIEYAQTSGSADWLPASPVQVHLVIESSQPGSSLQAAVNDSKPEIADVPAQEESTAVSEIEDVSHSYPYLSDAATLVEIAQFSQGVVKGTKVASTDTSESVVDAKVPVTTIDEPVRDTTLSARLEVVKTPTPPDAHYNDLHTRTNSMVQAHSETRDDRLAHPVVQHDMDISNEPVEEPTIIEPDFTSHSSHLVELLPEVTNNTPGLADFDQFQNSRQLAHFDHDFLAVNDAESSFATKQHQAVSEFKEPAVNRSLKFDSIPDADQNTGTEHATQKPIEHHRLAVLSTIMSERQPSELTALEPEKQSVEPVALITKRKYRRYPKPELVSAKAAPKAYDQHPPLRQTPEEPVLPPQPTANEPIDKHVIKQTAELISVGDTNQISSVVAVAQEPVEHHRTEVEEIIKAQSPPVETAAAKPAKQTPEPPVHQTTNTNLRSSQPVPAKTETPPTVDEQQFALQQTPVSPTSAPQPITNEAKKIFDKQIRSEQTARRSEADNAVATRRFENHSNTLEPGDLSGQAVKTASIQNSGIRSPKFGLKGLSNPPPRYPYKSRLQQEQGKVLLLVHVNTQGQAAKVETLKSSGYARLDRAAKKAVKKWTFIPAEDDGTVILGTVQVPISFVLKN